MPLGIRVVTFLQQVIVRREFVVRRTRLQYINEGESAMLQRCLEDFCQLRDVAGEPARNEGRLQREDEIHRRQRVLRDSIRRRIHRLPLPRQSARLAQGEAVVRIIVEDERHGVIAADRVNQVADSFGETRSVSTNRNHRNFGVRECRTGRKWQHTSVQSVESVALQFITPIPVTTDVVAEQHLPRV